MHFIVPLNRVRCDVVKKSVVVSLIALCGCRNLLQMAVMRNASSASVEFAAPVLDGRELKAVAHGWWIYPK